MIEWYLKVVRDNYANFSGRARRSEYWYFVLFSTIISIVLNLIDMFLLNMREVGVISTIYSLVVFIPSLAVAVRRLHDVGKSGWYYLLIFLPIIGWIWLLVLFFTEGDSGANEYGPDPKANYNEFEEIGKTDV
ncbi:DUF805 domain-containing protein [Flavobacterium salilacus subsp. salilacus]|uniref:DUF805 domain-containing protein n=1 Tax=Flavobacterium TaxID=237 RepID=UPI0010750CF8|nr:MULTISPECIES: DUF805 domain-containing protein [Flavobacterium]KAF2518853.1 DUF805 domain-containing protein [Flavobacterium salilacus subsp. salilacus]MBE1614988.1 DUF805 domain-containing protein [Flavobacterium sp. SaA2.13]